MVSFKCISSLLCVCAILCCFIGLAMPVSAAVTDLDLFTDSVFEFYTTVEEPDFGILYYYSPRYPFSLSEEVLSNFLTVNDSNSIYFCIGSSYFECALVNSDELIVVLLSGSIDDSFYILQIGRNNPGDPYGLFTFASNVDLGQSISLSVTNYMKNTDPAVSGFLDDLGDVASSSLGLVSSVVSTIINNPFLLLTVGFFFAGGAVAILGRILGKS